MSDEPLETNAVVDSPIAGEDMVDEQNTEDRLDETVPADAGAPSEETADDVVSEGAVSEESASEENVIEGPAAADQVVDDQATEEQAAEEQVAEDQPSESALGDDAPQLHVVSDLDDEDYDDEDYDDEEEEEEDEGDVQPLELLEETAEGEELDMDWYILKVQVNRENSICDALNRRVKVEGLERYFGEILVPTEDVREFTKSGKPRTVKRKLYPGYILVNMAINDDTWFIVRETPGIGDFTGSAGKPTPMPTGEVERILRATKPSVDDESEIKTTIKFKQGDRVRVKEGHFQNFEGEVESIDETHGRITVMINIFGRPTPVELEHWHVEDV